jgi:hypothetical protein
VQLRDFSVIASAMAPEISLRGSHRVRNVPNWCNWAQLGATFFPLHDERSGISRSPNRLTAKSESLRDGALGVLLNRLQMVLVAETLGVDLVDVFGARRPRGKPSRLGSRP